MFKKSKILILVSFLPLVTEVHAGDMRPRLGLNLGSSGLGVNVYGNTPWHINNYDQIQWNFTLEGGSFKNENDIELNKNDYRDVDLESIGTRAGVNWYPFFGNRFSNNVFFSSGLMYSKVEIEAKADLAKSFKADGKRVTNNDVNDITLDLESEILSPYISFGWGGRISDYKGFVFKAELGANLLKSDSDVKLVANDPSNFLTASNIENEKKDIEDEWNEIRGFVSLTLSYAF